MKPLFTIEVYSEKVTSKDKKVMIADREYYEVVMVCSSLNGVRKCEVRGRKRAYYVNVNIGGKYVTRRGTLESCLQHAEREIRSPNGD